MKKKILSLLLAAMMVLAVAGCRNTEPEIGRAHV